MACTTILVGKDASYDGSTIIARNEDSANGEFCPKRFIVVKPEDQPRKYKSVLSHVEIDLPDNPLQYTAVPNADLKEGIWGEAGVNEANVAMSATETLTTNERVLGADPFVELTPAKGKEGEEGYEPEVAGGIGEEDFLTLVLPYVTTAREGVERLGALLEEYGTYEMNGVAFSDVDEIWWLETVGGHHWIAKRVPDEAYVTMPNQLGIDEFDLEDAWLTGTALIHSLAVTEKRGCFRIWTVLLAILTFSLSLLGTFLVRSGVLTSVHAFATDPERGLFILAFLIIVIGLSFLLFAWRAPTVGLGGNFSLISRESMLLVNNVLLVVAMGAVLLGTLYPLFLDALNAGKISVGPPYFDAVFGPLMLPCVFLMGVGPLARWKDADPKALARELAWCLVAAIVAGAAIPLLMGEFGHWVFLGCTSAMFVFFAVIQTFRHQIRNQPGNVFARLMRQPRAFWGMQFAHIGVAVFIIGVALVKGYQSERDVRMYEGETVTVAGYTFTFNGVETVRGPNYTADRGDFTLSVNGRELQHLYPEKRKYYSSNSMPMTESAIRHSITGDVYVSLGTPTNDGGWVVRAYYKPYVTWIWWGCIIMAAAGLWAASDRRYRRRKQKNEADGE